MKAINEYINESIRLDEAKKIDANDLFRNISKIRDWVSPKNIKNLIASYMSAGDAEEFSQKHWDVCMDVISDICDYIDTATDSGYSEEKISLDKLTDDICDSDWLAVNLEDKYNKEDKEGDWDEDSVIDLFNTVSTKVCKEVWLI